MPSAAVSRPSRTAVGWASPRSILPIIARETPERGDAARELADLFCAQARRRADGLKAEVTRRDPGDWIDDQLADIRAKVGAGARAPQS